VVERGHRAGAQAGVVSGIGLLGEIRDLGARVRIVGQPPLDPDAPNADRCQRVAAIGELLRADDLRDGAEREARVAAADLAPAFDQDDTELAVALQEVLGHDAIARLEHVQRQERAREQHGAEREHRHHA
jgi:hypothetical protein